MSVEAAIKWFKDLRKQGSKIPKRELNEFEELLGLKSKSLHWAKIFQEVGVPEVKKIYEGLVYQSSAIVENEVASSYMEYEDGSCGFIAYIPISENFDFSLLGDLYEYEKKGIHVDSFRSSRGPLVYISTGKVSAKDKNRVIDDLRDVIIPVQYPDITKIISKGLF